MVIKLLQRTPLHVTTGIVYGRCGHCTSKDKATQAKTKTKTKEDETPATKPVFTSLNFVKFCVKDKLLTRQNYCDGVTDSLMNNNNETNI